MGLLKKGHLTSLSCASMLRTPVLRVALRLRRRRRASHLTLFQQADIHDRDDFGANFGGLFLRRLTNCFSVLSWGCFLGFSWSRTQGLTWGHTRGRIWGGQKMGSLICLLLGTATFLITRTASAQTPYNLTGNGTSFPEGHYLLAQAETADDGYDPFADYSEFEEAADEEEDINFFRNGRLLSLGFAGGYRGFTQNLAKMYAPGATFGLNLSYFFDLRFALQIGFSTSDHSIHYRDSVQTVNGAITYQDIGINLKYYFNTQNVTRGLANLNPFIIAGFSQVYRTTTLTTSDVYGKAAAFAFNLGAGIEIPMLRNKMFFGFQAAYQYVNFPDENQFLQGSQGYTNLQMNGDSFTVNGILGVNF